MPGEGPHPRAARLRGRRGQRLAERPRGLDEPPQVRGDLAAQGRRRDLEPRPAHPPRGSARRAAPRAPDRADRVAPRLPAGHAGERQRPRRHAHGHNRAPPERRVPPEDVGRDPPRSGEPHAGGEDRHGPAALRIRPRGDLAERDGPGDPAWDLPARPARRRPPRPRRPARGRDRTVDLRALRQRRGRRRGADRRAECPRRATTHARASVDPRHDPRAPQEPGLHGRPRLEPRAQGQVHAPGAAARQGLRPDDQARVQRRGGVDPAPRPARGPDLTRPVGAHAEDHGRPRRGEGRRPAASHGLRAPRPAALHVREPHVGRVAASSGGRALLLLHLRRLREAPELQVVHGEQDRPRARRPREAPGRLRRAREDPGFPGARARRPPARAREGRARRRGGPRPPRAGRPRREDRPRSREHGRGRGYGREAPRGQGRCVGGPTEGAGGVAGPPRGAQEGRGGRRAGRRRHGGAAAGAGRRVRRDASRAAQLPALPLRRAGRPDLRGGQGQPRRHEALAPQVRAW